MRRNSLRATIPEQYLFHGKMINSGARQEASLLNSGRSFDWDIDWKREEEEMSGEMKVFPHLQQRSL
ncbi:MAG: hypothetical protein A2V62_07470 [Nitrospirae bacterium RBG_19FT_COMBO_58_9]|nr:MAG: hypothetical protein A2V62_07470 [Nitrospirae bacterium RBG_19FT_COMBO_58_9]